MTDSQGEKIHNRFKKVRNELSLGQKEFAVGAGIKQSQVSAIESGKRNITAAIKLALEDNLKVNRVWLETGEGEMFLNSRDYSLDELPGAQKGLEEPHQYAKSTNYGPIRAPMYERLPANADNLVGYMWLINEPEGTVAVKVHDEDNTRYGTYMLVKLT
jgi:transcriptional regulator with XRE-family HTH domain